MQTTSYSPACYFRDAAAVGVQSILFHNSFKSIDRSTASLARSAELAICASRCSRVVLSLGDSSPEPCLTREHLALLTQRYGHLVDIRYDFFDANMGSAAGHNRLAESNDCDFYLIRNPDVVVSPRLLEVMTEAFRRPNVGMVEAKQLPIEHPKDYDATTGDTSWATTACAMIPSEVFRRIGGFDARSFFLYCDDVDFSWMVRRAGLRVIFQPAAMAFHDKRLSPTGQWQPSAAERYYSAEAALFLAHKWSRPDLVERYLNDFAKSGSRDLIRAHDTYQSRRANNALPAPIDAEHKVGTFVESMYAVHRYPL